MAELTGMSNKAAQELSKTLLYRMESFGNDQLVATEKIGMHNVRATTRINEEGDKKVLKLNIFWRDVAEGIGASITSYNEIIDGVVNIVRDTYDINIIQANGNQWSPGRLVTPEEIETEVADKHISTVKVPIRRSFQVLRFLENDLKEQFETQAIYKVATPSKLPEKLLARLTDKVVEKMTEGGSLNGDITVGSVGETEVDSINVVSKFINDEGRDKLSINMTFKLPLYEVSIEGRYAIVNGIPRVVPFYYWVVLTRGGRDIVVKPTTTVGVNGAVCTSNQKEFTKPIQECLELLQSVEVELRKQFES